MKWFSRKPATPAPRPPAASQTNAVNLGSLGAVWFQALSGLENAAVDIELLRARIADLCRDQQVEPPYLDQFLKNAQSLDAESQRRLALTVRGFDEESARAAFLRPG